MTADDPRPEHYSISSGNKYTAAGQASEKSDNAHRESTDDVFDTEARDGPARHAR